jgi:hypothetical protein
MLHIKPSKFDRARVLPIGDSLGRVIAEMVLHIKRPCGSERVPSCDAWDDHEKRPLPLELRGPPLEHEYLGITGAPT